MRKLHLILKDVNSIFKSKGTVIFFLLLSLIVAYSFYSAVDLYSKASISALNDPLYATGFEPVPGVFTPTFGGFFVILSLLAPFILIRLISDERKYGTVYLLAQMPFSFEFVYISKFISALFFVFAALGVIFPVFPYWLSLGGHIPTGESLTLILGYILYGAFVVSVSFFSASLFKEGAQASIMAIFLIMLSWFIDFGKDMNLLSFLSPVERWSVTRNLKLFETGILSLSATLYFAIITFVFAYLGYVFFDMSKRRKWPHVTGAVIIFMLSLIVLTKVNYNVDVTESRRNSFSPEKTAFLKTLPRVYIKIYLEPTDSRAKDYENDFLKRLLLVKRDVDVEYASQNELKREYGFFVYKIGNKSEKTYSNSEEEIFMVLKELSGRKIKNKNKENMFRGYPLVAHKNWSIGVWILYIFLIPFVFIIIFILENHRKKGGVYA